MLRSVSHQPLGHARRHCNALVTRYITSQPCAFLLASCVEQSLQLANRYDVDGSNPGIQGCCAARECRIDQKDSADGYKQIGVSREVPTGSSAGPLPKRDARRPRESGHFRQVSYSPLSAEHRNQPMPMRPSLIVAFGQETEVDLRTTAVSLTVDQVQDYGGVDPKKSVPLIADLDQRAPRLAAGCAPHQRTSGASSR